MQRVLIAVSLLMQTRAYLGPMMGIQSSCDDAFSNLQVDWDERDFFQFTCPDQHYWKSSSDMPPELYVIPKLNPRNDTVYHKCMNEAILYNDSPPLRGDHRPNWAVYGEYLYVPPQRWLHNLEHGAIILLYNPCVDRDELAKLRNIVTECLYRHVITPYNRLSPQRPLGLIAWGAKLLMNQVNETLAVNFIKAHAKFAPEDLSEQGKYQYYLIKKSDIVRGSDIDDTHLCPGF